MCIMDIGILTGFKPDQRSLRKVIDHCNRVNFDILKVNSYLAARLGEIKQKNLLIIAAPSDNFFCFIPPSLAAK